jgi:hypothetical protein
MLSLQRVNLIFGHARQVATFSIVLMAAFLGADAAMSETQERWIDVVEQGALQSRSSDAGRVGAHEWWQDAGQLKALRATNGPSVWDVLTKRDVEKQWTLRGSLLVEFETTLDSDHFRKLGSSTVLEGSFQSLNGTGTDLLVSVVALRPFAADSVLYDESGEALVVIFPIAVTVDEKAFRLQTDAAVAGYTRSHQAFFESLRPEIPQHRCAECNIACIADWQVKLGDCEQDGAVCFAAAQAITLSCITACAATGPATLVCLGGCILADAILVGVCVTQYSLCNSRATRDKNTCVSRCPPPAL